MAVNKVVINNETQLDLTADTVDAAHLAKGYTCWYYGEQCSNKAVYGIHLNSRWKRL